MAENSKIEWTDHTANFWWGCMKVSPGCAHCYADTLARRYGKIIWGPAATTDRELKKGVWKELPKWDDLARAEGVRRRVFVQSMADFFEDHPQVVEWRRDALHLISQRRGLDFLVLTKRPENVLRMIEAGTGRHADAWLKDNHHVWIGTSVEDQQTADERIPHLLNIPAAVRFLSMEPLLGPVDLLEYYREEGAGTYSTWLDYLDWVIVGGESGPNARPMHPDWARSIRDQCQAAGVAFFFKQWGEWRPADEWERVPGNVSAANLGRFWPTGGNGSPTSELVVKAGKHAAGRALDGRTWDEYPGKGDKS